MRKNSYFIFLLGIYFWSTHAFSTWIGVFVFRNILFDHIHITLSDDSNPDQGTMLNIWNSNPIGYIRMESELKQANKFILFHDDKSKDEIISRWQEFFAKIKSKRSLISKNCAFATQYVLQDILNLDIRPYRAFARFSGIFWIPAKVSLIPLPDSIRIKLKKYLNSHKRKFYTERNGRNLKELVSSNSF